MHRLSPMVVRCHDNKYANATHRAEKVYEWTAGKLKPVSHVAQAALDFVEDDDWKPSMVSF